MSRSVRLVLTLAALAVLAVSNVAAADAGGPKILDARLAGIPTAGLTLDGVVGGGAPWIIDEGRARLFADGRLTLDIDGLVLASNRTNPVASGRAIVTCGGAAVAFTSTVPFSPKGNARVETTVALPSPCLAPAVFFATGTNRWLAVTGF